jgi:D-alanine-D-alanine ligase
MKKKILVILGGVSKEREISLKSGKACIKAIKALRYKIELFDPAKTHFSKLKNYKVDLIFNSLHGKDGEDGIAQSYFEYFKIPYTHSGILASMNAMDKITSKEIFKKNKISSPKYFSFNSAKYSSSLLKKFMINSNMSYPVIIKPSDEGSSIGVRICKNFNSLRTIAEHLLKDYNSLIVEKFIGGQEIQVAVMNGKALGAIELKPRRNFYDYKAKYSKTAKTKHIMPANIRKEKYREVLNLAKKAHNVLKCRGVTRSDFKFENNKFWILETNTQPGMTDLSLVPEIAKYKGISFKKLVKNIILDASINR